MAEDETGIKAASAHLEAAARALGVDLAWAPDDRSAAVRVHALRPGVPAPVAYAVIQALRALGWKPLRQETVSADPETPLSDAERRLGEAGMLAQSMAMSTEPAVADCGRRMLAVLGMTGQESSDETEGTEQ
jgi:hypothetical protein